MSQPARVGFTTGGVACIGYLHLPHVVRGPLPCVVLCPGFGGTQDVPSIQAVARACVDAGDALLPCPPRGRDDHRTPRQREERSSGGRPRHELCRVFAGFFLIASLLPDDYRLADEALADLLAETVQRTLAPREAPDTAAADAAGAAANRYLGHLARTTQPGSDDGQGS